MAVYRVTWADGVVKNLSTDVGLNNSLSGYADNIHDNYNRIQSAVFLSNAVIVQELLEEKFNNSHGSIKQAAKALAKASQKIEAIRLIKSLTNCGLKEAKDYVDAL